MKIPNYLKAVAAFVLMASNSARGQIQQAWVAHYNNGIANGTHQAVKMRLDSAGNICVTGFSQNSLGNLGYVTIKYAPNGNQLWATRYDSPNSPSAKPAAMVLDGSNNVILTGSALTVKYDPNGNQFWTAPYAGTTLAVDSNGYVYVAGFSQNFATEKLTPQGSNVWQTTYVESYGPTISQSVLVDGGNNVYVSGLDSYYSFVNNGTFYGPYVTLTTIKYGSTGNQIWKESQTPPNPSVNTRVQVGGAALDSVDNLYLVSTWTGYEGYITYRSASNGVLEWTAYPGPPNGNNTARAAMLNNFGSILMTGVAYHETGDGATVASYGTIELATNGVGAWTNFYPLASSAPSSGTSLAIDSANNCYVTGYSPGINSGNDIVTIKYDPNGNQIWLHRYNGPANGDDEGNAIAVDSNGNVYVTGYETTTAGGTEIVTIKYSPVTLQRRADGSILLEAQGSPGESFDIQASADLQSWLDLGSVTADTNGLMQFDDANAANYPARFYVTSPQ
jgi:hypothetical protein